MAKFIWLIFSDLWLSFIGCLGLGLSELTKFDKQMISKFLVRVSGFWVLGHY